MTQDGFSHKLSIMKLRSQVNLLNMRAIERLQMQRRDCVLKQDDAFPLCDGDFTSI